MLDILLTACAAALLSTVTVLCVAATLFIAVECSKWLLREYRGER